MKQHYSKVPYFLALIVLILYLPRQVKAQCSCSDGTPALTQVVTYSGIFPSNNTNNISMPQFNSSTGTLVCVSARVSLTSVVRFRLENEASIPVTYTIKYLRFDTLVGPGINPEVTGMRMKSYGPFSLAAADGTAGAGPDFVTTGRDTVYNQVIYQTTTTNVVNYLGTGNVLFQYISDVPTYATGSDYYKLSVNSDNIMNFQLTYSYCQNSVLAQNIKNFNAVLTDKENVNVSWSTQNESKNNSYEIELSEDGKLFRKIGTTRAKPVDGAAAKYEYQYHLDKLSYRKLYFRVKQLSAGSQVYSGIRSVIVAPEPLAGVSIYPNPVVNNVNIQFDEPVTGDFQIQVVNQTGQVVHTSRARLNNNTTSKVLITNPPPPGIYYLRARDMTSEKTFSAKLLFSR